MSLRIMPGPVPQDDASRSLASIRFAGSLLVVGGALAFLASFLPLGQASFPPVEGDPATTLVTIPARALLEMVQSPTRLLGLSSLFELIGQWGLPLALAALGLVVLLVPRWRQMRGHAFVVVLAGLGIIFVLLKCLIFVAFTHLGNLVTPSTSFGIGPFIALLGYVCAGVGAVRLPVAPASRR